MRHQYHVRTSSTPSRSHSARLTMVLTTTAALLVPLVLDACASAGAGPATTSYAQRTLAPVGRQSSSDHVAPQELAAFSDVSLEEALRRVRPEWMRPSPTARQAAEPGLASVYVNDAYVGGLEALRLIPIDAVTDARYLTPSAARSWFGMFCRCTGGVILISTRTEN